jgi:acetolactate synthase-1/2/3 large subunit
LKEVIAQVMAMDGPVLCEVVAMRDQKIIPIVTSVKLPDGRMQSSQIHNMFPLLPDEVMAQELARAGLVSS